MTQVTYRFDHRFPIAVVRLTGALIARDARQVRAAVLESLEEEPTSLIIDLGGLTAVDDPAVQVFPGVAAEIADWPGCTVLLCNAPATVAQVLCRTRVDGAVTVYRTFEGALAAAAAEPVPQRVHERLEPSVHAPRAARELAAEACFAWGLPDCAVPTEIIASELVTNAVRHAGTTLDLRITLRNHQLRVSVRDRSAKAARLETPSESDDHGRGLLIVSSVATRWGSEPVAGGKVVWAALAVTPPEAATGSLNNNAKKDRHVRFDTPTDGIIN